MMHKLRENTKIILWIVVVAFIVTIFAVWGLDLQTGSTSTESNIIGKINGVPITRTQYDMAYRQIADQLRSASPSQALTYTQEEFIRTQAWDQLVYAVLTDQEIRKLGITVTDQEIVAYLRTAPPPEIRPYFVDDQGNFDNNRYQAELNNPANDWTNLEQLARERIPKLKLNGYLSAQVHVSEQEIRRAYAGETVELTVKYVAFPMEDEDVSDFEPTDDAIGEYYRAHADQFQEPDKVQLEVVRIALEPSDNDFEDAAFTANHVREQLLAGEDFTDLAKTFSDAPSAFVDGNTGFIGRDRRAAAYFDALDAMSSGDISEPVRTESGYYVLKLLEKKSTESGDPQYNAQEVFVKTVLARQTVDSLYNIATELRDRARETGLKAAADEKGLETLAPEPFSDGVPIGGIGFVPSLTRFGFGNEPDALSDVLRDENTIYLARVIERLPSIATPVSDVRDLIRDRLIYQRRKSMAEVKARAFFQKARTTDFETSAVTYDMRVQRPEPFRALDNLEGFGPNSEVAEAALALAPDQAAPPIEVDGRFVVLYLIDRSEIDPADYKQRIPALTDAIRNQKIQAYVGDWYESLKAVSQIEDNRSQS